ncbi:hypothetical protein F4781DRAFT_444340 [Annulohypoxylon bovei var. microspora]|nr:hypothetical protein F4781DRAFT_444340 [Annulohypoxylon bovei var. microspora]
MSNEESRGNSSSASHGDSTSVPNNTLASDYSDIFVQCEALDFTGVSIQPTIHEAFKALIHRNTPFWDTLTNSDIVSGVSNIFRICLALQEGSENVDHYSSRLYVLAYNQLNMNPRVERGPIHIENILHLYTDAYLVMLHGHIERGDLTTLPPTRRSQNVNESFTPVNRVRVESVSKLLPSRLQRTITCLRLIAAMSDQSDSPMDDAPSPAEASLAVLVEPRHRAGTRGAPASTSGPNPLPAATIAARAISLAQHGTGQHAAAAPSAQQQQQQQAAGSVMAQAAASHAAGSVRFHQLLNDARVEAAALATSMRDAQQERNQALLTVHSQGVRMHEMAAREEALRQQILRQEQQMRDLLIVAQRHGIIPTHHNGPLPGHAQYQASLQRTHQLLPPHPHHQQHHPHQPHHHQPHHNPHNPQQPHHNPQNPQQPQNPNNPNNPQQPQQPE